jgi:hypothetical protein
MNDDRCDLHDEPMRKIAPRKFACVQCLSDEVEQLREVARLLLTQGRLDDAIRAASRLAQPDDGRPLIATSRATVQPTDCPHCGSSESKCKAWKDTGAIACCPDCRHSANVQPIGTLESIRFDSDCVINGVEVKAGTTFKPVTAQQEQWTRCVFDGPPPKEYATWQEFWNARVKQDVYVRAVRPGDFTQHTE